MLDELPGAEPPAPIVTQRLELRPFTRDELEAVASGTSLPHFARGFPSAQNQDWARDALAAGEHFFTESRCAQRAVVERSSGQVIGAAGFTGPAMDHELEVEGSLVPQHRGQGLATEGLRALLEEAFEDPDVRAVQASVPTGEHPAHHVLARCGFQPLPSDGSEDSYRLPRP